MSAEKKDIEGVLEQLAGGLSEILREQKAQNERLGSIEKRIEHVESQIPSASIRRQEPEATYDYRILRHTRRYEILDSEGKRASMTGTQQCIALRDLNEVRTRYHTGSGERTVLYEYRIVDKEGSAGRKWHPVEYRLDKGPGPDCAAYLIMPEPILSGEVFEVRHSLKLEGAFTTKNEWVTLVVQYPTESFKIEVILPGDRKILGSRREESDGASHSFNKRRVIPQKIPESGKVSLAWEFEHPITGRSYTLFWDW